MPPSHPHTIPDQYKNHQIDLTVSGYVLDHTRSKILLLHHKKLDRWMVPGGHIDPNEMPHIAVLREIKEETGVSARFVDLHPEQSAWSDEGEWLVPSPFATMVQLLPAYRDVPEHLQGIPHELSQKR